jgi:N-acyl-D-amino-acid deacylase
VLREAGRGAIELALSVQTPGHMADEEYDLLEFLVRESTRPVTWLALFNRPGLPDSHLGVVEKVQSILGWDKSVPQVSCRPLRIQFNMRNPFIFAVFTTWHTVFNKSLEEQIKIYSDPGFRLAFREEDVFLDLAVADNLDLVFDIQALNYEPEGIKRLITDPRFMIGLSDGGAHVDMLCDAPYATYLLGTWVRERQALSLEEGVRRPTSEPARFFGIPKRGQIAQGMAADLVLFDPDTVAAHEPEYVHDLPGGAKRFVAYADGIKATIVSGKVLYQDGEYQGGLPGQVLRSYDA